MTSHKPPPSCHRIYVVMQKRGDERVYPDMHKATGRFFLTPWDARKALEADPDLAPYRHVVQMVAMIEADWDEFFKGDV